MIYKAYTKDGRVIRTAQSISIFSVDYDCVYLYSEDHKLLAAVSMDIFGLVESVED